MTGQPTILRTQLGQLAEHLRPALALPDLDTLTSGLAELGRCGSGAHRQRTEFGRRHRLQDVVDLLAGDLLR